MITALISGMLLLAGTQWQFVEKIFVADAGTMTITHTLSFTSDKEVTLTVENHMPSYPAMYVNPDGTIDRIPGSHSVTEKKGTWSLRRKVLTITFEDGSEEVYDYTDGKIVSLRRTLSGETIEFTRLQ